jgi:hypothetical protein
MTLLHLPQVFLVQQDGLVELFLFSKNGHLSRRVENGWLVNLLVVWLLAGLLVGVGCWLVAALMVGLRVCIVCILT